MIDWIQRAGATHAGLVINPGGYSHTSVAIADALRAISIPVIEVHLSNLFERETFRHNSITAAASNGVIMGLGPLSYVLALHAVARRLDRDAGAQPSAP
jgi:3-dehydroquinate dehydratase-2